MTMTLGEMRTEVLSTVGGQYTANVDRYLNKGLRELSSKAEVLTRADAVISSGSCAIPTNCLIMRDVYYNGQKLSRYEGTDVPDDDNASSQPYEWLKDGSNIKFYPISANGETVQLVYVKNDATLVDDDDVPTLEHCEDFLISFAKSKVLADTAGPTDLALFWKQEAETERYLWEKLNKSQNSRPRKVRVGRYC